MEAHNNTSVNFILWFHANPCSGLFVAAIFMGQASQANGSLNKNERKFASSEKIKLV